MDGKDYQHLLQIIAGAILLLIGSVFLASDEQESLGYEEVLENGAVNRVIDGDTIDVVIDEQVVRTRLIGIDTPETVDPRKEVQCFGLEATQHLKDILVNHMVTVESDESQGLVDKYDRALVYLKLDDGTNVAEQMLRDGFAYEYTYDDPYKYQELFKNAEQDARDSERGLWSSETCGGNR